MICLGFSLFLRGAGKSAVPDVPEDPLLPGGNFRADYAACFKKQLTRKEKNNMKKTEVIPYENMPSGRRFPKGVSGNPDGRPKRTQVEKDALEKIRSLAPKAVETLEVLLPLYPPCREGQNLRADPGENLRKAGGLHQAHLHPRYGGRIPAIHLGAGSPYHGINADYRSPASRGVRSARKKRQWRFFRGERAAAPGSE